VWYVKLLQCKNVDDIESKFYRKTSGDTLHHPVCSVWLHVTMCSIIVDTSVHKPCAVLLLLLLLHHHQRTVNVDAGCVHVSSAAEISCSHAVIPNTTQVTVFIADYYT